MNLRPQREVSKFDVPGLVAEAHQCVLRYHFAGAIEILERVKKLEPNNEKALVELGSAYAKAYDFAAAERCFQEAIEVASKKDEVLNVVGYQWMEVRHLDAARQCFEQVLNEPVIPILTYLRLAEVYIRLRKLDQAVAITERGLKTYGAPEALVTTRARIHRQMGKFHDAERLLRAVVNRLHCEPSVRAGAWYEMAHALDQMGDYDRAWSALLEAKEINRANAGPALKILKMKQGQLRQMREKISPELIKRWRKSGETELQPQRRLALLGGHARSGTTLLENVLDSHPGVVSAEETALYHNVSYYPLGRALSPNSTFLSALEWLPARTMRQIRSEYFRGLESFLGQPVGDRFLVDKNPANTFDLPSLARIFPEMKFLIALRDPRDVCLSCFMQPVAVIPDTSAWLTIDETMNHFAHIMGLWVAWKPSLGDAAIEVRYEDMVDNLEPVARRSLEFLGIEWDPRVLKFDEHARSKVVRSPTYADVTRPIYKTAVARWRNYEKYFAPHMDKLAPIMKPLGYE